MIEREVRYHAAESGDVKRFDRATGGELAGTDGQIQWHLRPREVDRVARRPHRSEPEVELVEAVVAAPGRAARGRTNLLGILDVGPALRYWAGVLSYGMDNVNRLLAHGGILACGNDAGAAADRAARRLESWGMTTGGKGRPATVMLRWPQGTSFLGMPDVYSPQFAAAIDAALKESA